MVPKRETLKKLKHQIESIENIKTKSLYSAEFKKWQSNTEDIIKEIYGKESSQLKDFNSIFYTPIFLSCRMDDSHFDAAYRDGLDEAYSLLLSFAPPGKQISPS